MTNLGVLDRISLELGRETTRFLTGSGLHAGLERIAPDRLAALPSRFRRNLDRKIRIQPEPYRSYATHREVIEEVLDGLLRERLLAISYQRFDGVERHYDSLMPLTMVLYRRALYIIVRRTRDRRTFTLAIDRVSNVDVLDSFSYPEDWSPGAMLGEQFGMVSSSRPERIVLRFTTAAAAYVRARTWHKSQVFHERPDGFLDLEMTASGREILRMVLEWGPLCEVIEPESLRNEVAKSLQEAADLYKTERSES